MADDGSQQSKPDFRTAVEDIKALAKELVGFVLRRRLRLRSPAVLATIGVVGTIVVALLVILTLQQTGDPNAVSDNAAVIGALLGLGGIGTAQMVSIALDQRRTEHEALQAYLAKMTDLLLDKNQNLHGQSAEYASARVSARLQTINVLERLDAERKRTVLLFLREAQLINRFERFDPIEVGHVMFYAHYVGLRGADLSGANLSGAQLISASGEDPIILKEANLKGANLSRADLRGADLAGADLRGANLRGVNLQPAKRHKTDLSGLSLIPADLSGADLSGAVGITAEDLEQQAASLEGATMPDGSKHP